jgi:hypothetical protein
MNVHLQPVSFKKYSLILIYAFFFMAVIAWFMEIYFEKLYGDLARVGNFPERYFGWQAPQPSISPELFKDYSFAEADIIVIGDSFSIARIWQTKLIADGLKVGTITWEELRTNVALPSNLGEALRAAGFKGRYVVIESIERLFQMRMNALAKEIHPIVKHNIVINSSFPLYPFTQRERLSLNKLNGLGWGVKALYNTIKLFLNLPDKYLKSGPVQAISFDGCQLFSHRLCNYAIFVEDDLKKPTFNSIANVLTVNKNLQSVGIQPIWPDKATVYLGYGALNQHPYQNIWQLLAQYPELIAPDLGAAFIPKSRTVKDFYMPNDTHLSTNGFLYLGDYMAQFMRKTMADQSKAFSP